MLVKLNWEAQHFTTHSRTWKEDQIHIINCRRNATNATFIQKRKVWIILLVKCNEGAAALKISCYSAATPRSLAEEEGEEMGVFAHRARLTLSSSLFSVQCNVFGHARHGIKPTAALHCWRSLPRPCYVVTHTNTSQQGPRGVLI